MVMAIRQLDNETAIKAIESLKSKKRIVKGTKGRDLKLSIVIENTGNSNQHDARALLDSGTMGSCINWKFTKKHKIPIQKLPIKMPVYNADGTLNARGSIEGFAKVRMIIGDHAE